VTVIGGPEDRGAVLENPRAVLTVGDAIVVLEPKAPHVKLFGIDGKVRQQFGRDGSGPGEFRFAAALAYDSATRRLVVFDPANGRADYYRLTDTLRYETSLRSALPVQDGCFLRGRLFVLALHDGHIVQELSSQPKDLSIQQSIGEPKSTHPLADHPIFRRQVVQGSIFCDAVHQQLVVASLSVGAVQLLSLPTLNQVTIQLDGFVPLAFTAVDGGGLRQSAPPGGEYDESARIRPAADGVRVIVGHVDRDHRGVGDYAKYQEMVVSQNGGQKKGAVSSWLEVGAAQGRVVCYQGAPYPTVAVFAAPRCP
jgi:hypothetical protein